MGLLHSVRKLFADDYEREMIEALQSQEMYAAHVMSSTSHLMTTPERAQQMRELEAQGRRLWELTGRRDLLKSQMTLRAYRTFKDKANDDRAKKIAEIIGDMHGSMYSDSPHYLLACIEELGQYSDRRMAPFLRPFCKHEDENVREAAQALLARLA